MSARNFGDIFGPSRPSRFHEPHASLMKAPRVCFQAPAPPTVAKDAQVALFGKEAPALVNTAAGATSGDDVSAALKAARVKATTKAGAV